MKDNYECEIQLFYKVMIEPQLKLRQDFQKDLYLTAAEPKMKAVYDNINGKVVYLVVIERNPIYKQDVYCYDCGAYDLHEILSVAYIYDKVKIEERRGW